MLIDCPRCGATDFGIEEIETDMETTYSIYCKNCDRTEHTWGYPTEKAFLKEE